MFVKINLFIWLSTSIELRSSSGTLFAVHGRLTVAFHGDRHPAEGNPNLCLPAYLS